LLGVPRQVLERETLIEAEWPAPDLNEARKVLASVDACELATARARGQIEESDGDVTPSSLCTTLDDLITSWSELRKTQAASRKGEVLAMQRVDLAVEARATTIRLLCDALLDKAIELHEDLRQKARDTTSSADEMVEFGQRLRSFLEQDWVQEVLKALQVDVPKHEVFQAKPSATASPAPDAVADAGGSVPDINSTDVGKKTPPRPPDSEAKPAPDRGGEAAAEGRAVDSSQARENDDDPLLQTLAGHPPQ